MSLNFLLQSKLSGVRGLLASQSSEAVAIDDNATGKDRLLLARSVGDFAIANPSFRSRCFVC